MQEFVDDHSECPDVSLGSVKVVNKSLWRHIDWRAYVDVLEIRSGGLGKSEISNLGLPVLDEDVCHL